MASRLLDEKLELRLWNRSAHKASSLAERGGIVCNTPREVAVGSDVVCLCLLSRDAVAETVFGIDGIANAQGARLLIDHSSISPSDTRDFAERLFRSNGMQWVDAPVSGGVNRAKAGTLTAMTGGAAEAVNMAHAAMQPYVSHVTHMGEIGAGQTTKLCNQVIVSAAVIAMAEASALAVHSGIDTSKLLEGLRGGWADSEVLRTLLPRMLSDPGNTIGAVSTMLKDLDVVGEVSVKCNTPMPSTTAVRELFRMACARGWANADLARVADLYY